MAFKNTIAGKILKGLSKVVKPALAIGGAVLGVGAISGVVKGVGAGTGIAQTLKGGKSLVSKVGQSAVNLVTGTTKEERDQVKEITKEAKAAQDKLDQVQRLIDAGATRARAESMVGITAAELGSANSDIKDAETKKKLETQQSIQAGGGCAVLIFSFLQYVAAGTLVFFLIFG